MRRRRRAFLRIHTEKRGKITKGGGVLLFEKAKKYAKRSGILKMLESADTVIVGLSGGADSVCLLHFLLSLKNDLPHLSVKATHVNHMIRGSEAIRDEEFCKELCTRLEVPLDILRADIPAIAKKEKKGLEECARDERYSHFARLLETYPKALVATAHNADDNLETMLFNLTRGSGTRGLSGISPVRESFIRPLLSCTSRQIREHLERSGIPFVTDSTNCDTAYTRNSIRYRTVPTLEDINPRVQDAALRLGEAARNDCDFIESKAIEFIDSQPLTRERLKSAHPALFQRIIRELYRRKCQSTAELSEKNVTDCRRLLEGEGGSVSLPGSYAFFADKYFVGIRPDTRERDPAPKSFKKTVLIFESVAHVGDYSVFLTQNENYINTIQENIYNLSLHVQLDCGKMNGRLSARTRLPGDTVRIHGMTKKLKKLFCDCGVPKDLRDTLPLIEDSEGIVFAPFIGARDGCLAPADANDILTIHIYKEEGEKR